MKKRYIALLLTAFITAGALTACSGESGSSSGGSGDNSSSSSSSSSEGSNGDQSSASSTNTADSSDTSSASQTGSYNTEIFSDGDFKDVSGENPDASITLSGNSGTISDTTRGSSGSTVTITSKGIYKVSGSSENVSIVIDDSTKSGNIYLILDNVTMTNSTTACINVKNCDKLIIQCTGENSLTSSNTSADDKVDGAIYAKNDVTVNGSGSLTVKSALHGIVCKKDLRITGSSLTVNADSVGIKAGKSLGIGGGKVNITSGHDGAQVSGENTSYFYTENSDITINAGYDGISVKQESSGEDFTGYINLSSGSVNITSGGGSDNSKDSNTSQKGLKCDGNIILGNAQLTVSSADDAVHGNSDITAESSTVTLSSSDDGITASGNLTINGGKVTVSKSYEGLEAENVTINDGEISITSSDDGINCSGGSDTSSNDDNPWSQSNTNAKLTVNGGNVYVNASGDGLDSNGSIYVTGGTVIVEGPTSPGNGALDIGDGQGCVASITGGTVLAIGTSDMAVNFNDGSQCSALVSVSGDAGSVISVDDGSGFSFTTTKSFSCAVYSSSSMKQGSTYTVSAGSSSASADFSSSLYYSEVQSMGHGGGMRGPGGF